MGGPVYVGFDPASGEDKTAVVVIDEAGEIVAADIEAIAERNLDRWIKPLGGHLGKTQMRFQAAMEAMVFETITKPLLRGFGKSRAGEATRTALGHYYDEMVATSRCPADPAFDAPAGDILIRTGNASYPAWVLH